MHHRIIHLAAPLTGYLGRCLIRIGQRGGEGQFLLQRRTHPLMGLQTPPLSNRTAPMFITGVLSAPRLDLNGAGDASQAHPLLSPVVNLSVAEGGKLRLGGWPPPEAFAPAVDASIHGLP